MENPRQEIRVGRHLADRLYPVALGIGLLLSLCFPAAYFILGYNALRDTAKLYAEELSEKFGRHALEVPGLWKYRSAKHMQLLREFLPYKDVTTIRVLDENGYSIRWHEYTTAKAETWWNRYAPVGSAPITFNNRTIGTVQIGISQSSLLRFAIPLLLLSTTIGGGLALLVYLYPVKVVAKMEEQLQDLLERLQGSNIELEAKVKERTRGLRIANAELQEALHEAEVASRGKSEFLANMSHELRTPLNSVLGFSQLLAQQGSGPLTEKQARYVDNIHTSGKHLLALISDLLDLSKLEGGYLELRPEPFALPEALGALLREIRPQAEVKGLTLELHVDAAPATLRADPLRFKQILYNLLSNAIKFTPTGGRITVTARRVPSSGDMTGITQPGTWNLERGTPKSLEYIEISVADSGIGITPEELPRLFQPFTQLEPVLTKHYGGTGLGLALTKRLVELHGGAIWAESAGEGKGSTFTVCLPLVESRGAPRLLVVDDDETLVAALREALEAAGFQVETAGDGEAALTQMESALPDLLILDLSLPKMDGWEVLRRLRTDTSTQALRVLVITGVEVERGDEVLTAGAQEFLTKPFSMTVLESTIRRLLEQGASVDRMRGRQATA